MSASSLQHPAEPLVSVSFCAALAEITLSNGPLNLVTRPMLRDLNAAIGAVRE